MDHPNAIHHVRHSLLSLLKPRANACQQRSPKRLIHVDRLGFRDYLPGHRIGRLGY